MAPDINSLPPPSATSGHIRVMASSNGNRDSNIHEDSSAHSPRSPSISLQAAATLNAGLQHEPSRRSSSSSLSRHRSSPQAGRRRSAVLMNLQLNDPAIPGPGEMVTEGGLSGARVHSPQPLSSSPSLAGGYPHHIRTPSLGELHQELEAEQEAQVNRLLQMIRQQQVQIQQYQATQGQTQSSVAAEDPVPTPQQGVGASSSQHTPSASTPRSPAISHPRSSFDIARDALHRGSRTPSRTSSPRMRSTSISAEGEPHLSGVRDESAYYQAETQSLVRENQMLRHRIRELERQLGEANATVAVTREPVHHSQLTHSTSVSEEEAASSSAPPAAASTSRVSTAEFKDE